MRFYAWGNMYLASIQQGIQALHLTSELYQKYSYPCDNLDQMHMLYDWGRDHKTVIVLNGGESTGLKDIANQFRVDENPYPWTQWYESQDALNDALTCVGIVVPTAIVEAVEELRASKRQRRRPMYEPRLSEFEFELVKLIFYSHMAR